MLRHLVFVSVLLLPCWRALAADAPSVLPLSATQRQSLGIEVASVVAKQATTLAASAKVVLPPQSIQVVAAPAAGLLTQLQRQVGETVKAGEKLATLVAPEVVEAQRHYLQSKLKHQLATENAARDQHLAAQGLLAQNTWLLTQNELKQAQADLDAATASLRLLGVKPEQAGSEITLYAPQNGTVLEILAEPGQRVQSADPLVKIANLQQLGLEIPLPPAQAKAVSIGQSVAVPDAQARISRIQPTLDAAQNVVVYADLQQTAINLHPGQTVNVNLVSHAAAGDSVNVPTAAVVWSGEQASVFVENADGFSPTPVKVLAQDSQNVTLSGLPSDSRVAVKGAAALKAQWQGE